MPSSEETQRYLAGAWRMMTGRPDGLRAMDVTVDGFWNSFFAIVVALPALVVGWVTVTNEMAGLETDFGSRLSLVLRFAVIDIGTWVLPIAVLAFAVRPAGLADRFVPYVVATNWASALIVWIMVPPAILRLLWPDAAELATLLSLGLFLATLFLLWRVTNISIDRGPGMATAVFFGMFAASLAVLFLLQGLLGVTPGEAQVPIQ